MEHESLWKDYKEKKDPKAREKLIEHHVDVVKIVAGRLSIQYGGHVEYDDLVSYGIFGLIDAIEKFDLGKEVKFRTYAQIRVRGAMIDQLRNLDWIPRSIRQKAKKLERAYQELEELHKRHATEEEVARHMEISKEELQDLLTQVNSFNLVSLEEKLEEGTTFDLPKKDEEVPENIYIEGETYEILRNRIDDLPDREKQVISLYYYEELTYKEIGEIIGISESRVSQIHSKAIIRLKNQLT